MTSAESALLGILIGAALAWLGAAVNSRTQWQREEYRRQQEQRAELYQDIHTRASRLSREQRTRSLQQLRNRSDEWHDENERWFARVALFASPEVAAAWDAWFNLHAKGWNLDSSGDDEDPDWWAAHFRELTEAHATLTAQMRKELEDPARAHIRLRRNS